MLVPGRLFSRAYLAVALAASEDDGRPLLYRAVHIEEYRTGVRLLATDSYWLAQSWVPRVDLLDNLTHREPPIDELPDRVATLIDDEWRIRDLMRHVAKITRKPDSDPVDVRLDLIATAYDDARPTLSPDLAARRVRVEIPDRERVLAIVHEAPDWTDWRSLEAGFNPVGGSTSCSSLSDWMLTALAKIPRLFGAQVLDIDWCDTHRAVWRVRDSSFDFAPHGLFMAARPVHDRADDAGLGNDEDDTP